MIIIGVVIHGNKLGRTIGYPTANINPNLDYINNDELGIYSCECKLLDTDEKYKGMASLGLRPTIGDLNKPLLEVNLFNFNSDLYDKTLEVKLIKKIRNELKFDNLDDLIQQIKKDEILIKSIN